MGHRLTRIYTRTGDNGTTGLADGTRVDKSSLRIEAIGEVDELNSLTGMLIADDIPDDLSVHLSQVQHSLFDLGGELATGDAAIIGTEMVQALEHLIDRYNEQLPPLREFILPGGDRAAAVCHLARAVCRRAERRLCQLQKAEAVNEFSLAYLNRLSDLLFVFARTLARRDGGGEIFWQRDR